MDEFESTGTPATFPDAFRNAKLIGKRGIPSVVMVWLASSFQLLQRKVQSLDKQPNVKLGRLMAGAGFSRCCSCGASTEETATRFIVCATESVLGAGGTDGNTGGADDSCSDTSGRIDNAASGPDNPAEAEPARSLPSVLISHEQSIAS